MFPEWLSARKAIELGTALADEFAVHSAGPPARNGHRPVNGKRAKDVEAFLKRADREVRPYEFNFYQRVRFANSFKWRLMEKGWGKQASDEMTQMLLLRISLQMNGATAHVNRESSDRHEAEGDSVGEPRAEKSEFLLSQGKSAFAQRKYADALGVLQKFVELNPRHAEGLNVLGTVHQSLGHGAEAEALFRRAITIQPTFAQAHCNLGTVLIAKGDLAEAEASLLRALNLQENYPDARARLGATYLVMRRTADAAAQFETALQLAPETVDALIGLGNLAKLEGRFKDAEKFLLRAQEIQPHLASACAGLAGIRRMTKSDVSWLNRAKGILKRGVAPINETNLRFALGKYYDDIDDYEQAFRNYRRANVLARSMGKPYDREKYAKFADAMIAAYPDRAVFASTAGANLSSRPVFIVGMPRSGSSLVEQIVASHPEVAGAGELNYWEAALREHSSTSFRGRPDAALKARLADEYLAVLQNQNATAKYVVDKGLVNSDFLGIIHSVFPRARIIYVRRNPIDSCLSCYFQQFFGSMSFTTDLSDLAHYYGVHRRLIAHWRSTLPHGALLDVPYESLVTDQEGWTRKMLEFLDLEWSDRCMDFLGTQRLVATASFWQVRQKIYTRSVGRWRNYEKFIGPLLELSDTDSTS